MIDIGNSRTYGNNCNFTLMSGITPVCIPCSGHAEVTPNRLIATPSNFFHFRTLQTLRQLKKNYAASPSGKGVQHVSQPAAVCAGVQQCSEFFAQLLVSSIYHLFVLHWIFWNNANTLLTVDSDDLFGPWQVTIYFLVNCKDRRAGALPEICNEGLLRGCWGRVTNARKICILLAKIT